LRRRTVSRSKSKVKAPEMKRTWLVQRLEKPRQWMLGGKTGDNPFAFGGGLRNGGLSPEAMDLLRPIFSFDYMGAAEFEFGAVPEALQRIAKFSDGGLLAGHTFDIALTDVLPDWREPKGYKPDGSATIYVLAPQDWMPEVEDRVREWAGKGYGSNLKEPTNLDRALRSNPDAKENYWEHLTGWLELDNGFMFFTDEEMWRKTADIFGVEIP
jgi:hypothetical protein